MVLSRKAMQKWERNREPPPPYGVSAKRNAYIDDDARFMEKRQQVSMDDTLMSDAASSKQKVGRGESLQT